MSPEYIFVGWVITALVVIFTIAWVADKERALWKAVHNHDERLGDQEQELSITDRTVYGEDFIRVEDSEEDGRGLKCTVGELEEKVVKLERELSYFRYFMELEESRAGKFLSSKGYGIRPPNKEKS